MTGRIPPHAYTPPPSSPREVSKPEIETAVIRLKTWIGNEQTIFTSSRRWAACDVFGDFPEGISAAGTMTIKVYAIVDGGPRVLVASGKAGHVGSSGMPTFAKWLAAARAVASRFEVTAQFAFNGPGTPADASWTAHVACSDHAVAPPDDVGRIWAGRLIAAASLTTAELANDPELLWVSGVTGPAVAAPRFLHVRETPAAADAPSLCFPLGQAGAGGAWHVRQRFTGRIYVYASSTYDTTTSVADCLLQAVVR